MLIKARKEEEERCSVLLSLNMETRPGSPRSRRC